MKDEAPRSAPPKQIPPKDSKPSIGESATQFASGFAKGVSEESRQLYNDTKELPSQFAKAGTELAEDLKSGRELRALAPLRAASHALRNASRKDAERIAHAAIESAREWLEKPAYEKGESLGRATTAIASEVAIDVLTEGIGSVATLRKVGKVAEAADHARDAEKVAERTARVVDHSQDAARTTALRPGQPFTKGGKREIWSRNAAMNDGTNKCDFCEVEVLKPQKHTRGVTPPSHEGQVDHVTARSKGGSGTPDNGQLLCRDCNLEKSNR